MFGLDSSRMFVTDFAQSLSAQDQSEICRITEKFIRNYHKYSQKQKIKQFCTCFYYYLMSERKVTFPCCFART